MDGKIGNYQIYITNTSSTTFSVLRSSALIFGLDIVSHGAVYCLSYFGTYLFLYFTQYDFRYVDGFSLSVMTGTGTEMIFSQSYRQLKNNHAVGHDDVQK